MKKINAKWIICIGVFLLIITSSAWADGKRGRRHSEGWHARQHHQSHVYADRHHGYHKRPYHYDDDDSRRYHKRRHHRHHRSRRHHHHHYYAPPPTVHHHHYNYPRPITGGYIFSAGVFEPGWGLIFSTGSSW